VLGAGARDERSRMAWLWLVPGAIAAGALAPISPVAALAMAGGAVGLVLLALGRRTTRLFLLALAVVLTGYAFAGRGFAYLGAPPVYVGEVVLVLGVFALVTSLPTRRPDLVHVLLVGFIAWGAIRTLPYLGTYGFDAVRDGAVWGYAIAALAVSLLVKRAHVHTLVVGYGRLLPFFVIWVPIFAAIEVAAPALLPFVPGTGVQIPFFKPGDLAVHLAGAAAFLLAGLSGSRGWRELSQPVIWAFWLAGFVVISALSRAGMLAIATVGLLPLFIRAPRHWASALIVGLLLLSVVGLTNLEVDIGGRRDISAGQLLENLRSVVGESDDPSLVGTRQWREEWWDTIIGYTVGGPYFWQGKGFGVNLAEDDGVQAPDETLRAPHNGHLNILARTGVPGLGLWVILLAAFAATLVRAARTAARTGQRFWLGVVAWIFVYWSAAVVNMTFDVYLEGPQGGIFFWSLMGLGLAVASFIRAGRPVSMPERERTPRWRESDGESAWPMRRPVRQSSPSATSSRS